MAMSVGEVGAGPEGRDSLGCKRPPTHADLRDCQAAPLSAEARVEGQEVPRMVGLRPYAVGACTWAAPE